MKKLLFSVFLTAFVCAAAVAQPAIKPEKLPAETIIKRHLDSIGSEAARTRATSRVFIGTGQLDAKAGYVGVLNGPAQLASDGRKVLFALILSGVNYRYEKVGFDGKDLTVGKPDGRFTLLAEFLRSQSAIVKDGYFTGVLSSAWPFLRHDGKSPKFERADTEELGGRWFYRLKSSRGDLDVSLYFDPTTFRHVASRYEYTIAPRLTTSEIETPKQQISRFTMVEQFSDYRTFGDLTLPTNYTIDVTNEEEGVVSRIRWSVAIQKAYFDQVLDAAAFRVS